MIIILLIFGAGFGTAWYIKTSKPEGEIVESDDKSIDLEMPGEVEREAITKEDVQIKLKELEEFSTYEGDYEVTLKKEETRYMLDDIKIPGTTNSIEITCDGVVKAGYDLNDIEVRIDDNTIYISLPDSPNINDNYIKWDTVECSEKNIHRSELPDPGDSYFLSDHRKMVCLICLKTSQISTRCIIL